MEHQFKKIRLEHWQLMALLLMAYDITAIHGSYFLGLWARYDFIYSHIPPEYLASYAAFITPYALLCVAVFWLFRLYRSLWRYASYIELIRVSVASLGLSALHMMMLPPLFGHMPLSYYLFGGVFQFLTLGGIRFSYRMFLFERNRRWKAEEAEGRVMIIGAGSAGQMLLRDVNLTRAVRDRVVCFIDDNPNKWHRYVEGVPVVGGREDIFSAVQKYRVNKIYLAIPTERTRDRKELLGICNETGCELKQLPAMYQLVLGQVTVSSMRDVSVEDLLGRKPIQADMKEVFDAINGKVVLVTGGGGSIGSELCRQIAAHNPKRLILFDIYENNAYEIQLELRKTYPELKMDVLIGSVRDSRRLFEVFGTYRPQIVYHAAAHKHVPLMEDSPNEAIKNNTIGTYKTAYAAMIHGCERFVLISTDKAVNPTNVMGASKRLCEMIIQCFDAMIKAGRAAEIPQLYTHQGEESADKDGSGAVFRDIRTEFVAVRFGNVLGSNGSVVPIFKKQVAAGGPVTVTHPDIIRYFMTISEAVSLVMLAGTYAHGGEIFVLDMGSPVKIDTLARNVIKLSGYQPDVDIKVEYTGLRPGEKLYEEKLMDEEGLRTTENDLIFIGSPIQFDTDVFLRQLRLLMEAAYTNCGDIRQRIAKLVPTYHAEGIQPGVQSGGPQKDGQPGGQSNGPRKGGQNSVQPGGPQRGGTELDKARI